jgi:O-antigen/teichoic acid export membrane protein
MLANFGAAGFVAVLQIATIPLYLHLAGPEQWGQLSTVLALAAALLTLESGVSTSVARHIALAADSDMPLEANLRRLEVQYGIGSLAVALAGVAAQPFAQFFFPNSLQSASALLPAAGLMAACQIDASLYRAILVGRGRHEVLARITVLVATLRHSAALAMLWLGMGAVGAALAIAAASVLEALLRRHQALRFLTGAPTGTRSINKSSETLFRGGTLALVLTGTLGALMPQLDRVVLASQLGATAVGQYAIAATLSLAVLQFVYPVSTSLIPQLNGFVSTSARKNKQLRWITALALAAILVSAWTFEWFMSRWGLQLWLRQEQLTAVVAPLFAVHLVGTSLNVLCVPLHLKLLANHQDFSLLSGAIASLAAQMTALVVGLSLNFGPLAGSLAWCIANATLLFVYLIAVWRIAPGVTHVVGA